MMKIESPMCSAGGSTFSVEVNCGCF